MSDPRAAPPRGGPQVIPRPARWRPGPGATWSRSGTRPAVVTVDDVRTAVLGDPAPLQLGGVQLPTVTLPGPRRPPAGVLCAVFEEDGQAHTVLTRRSSRLRTHSHQVSFPGGRQDGDESPLAAALREAQEEVGLDPSTVEVVGRLPALQTLANPSPITPYVGVLPGRPELVPNPTEVERAFTVPLVELTDPEVYREELWTFPDGDERDIHFFELVGDTVWGATARMLVSLLDLVVPVALSPR